MQSSVKGTGAMIQDGTRECDGQRVQDGTFHNQVQPVCTQKQLMFVSLGMA